MCGISGFFGFENKELLRKMIKKLSKRGPENTGIAISNFSSIANARLSIIDVVGGNQPIWNKEENLVIVANCEIYNYQHIRDELISLGYSFKTRSDTEVILLGYEEWGIDITNKIDGIYAVAIIDFEKKSLILIRDRLGIKPLYYYHDGTKFLFGSEIKAILEDEEIDRVLSKYNLQIMLQFGYIFGDMSLFKDIKQVLPGHTMVITKTGIESRKYWDLPKLNNYDSKLDLNRFEQLIEKAVESQLISERPVGIFLSGGLDSSLIAAYASKYSDKLSLFTQSFGKVDESIYAKKVAEHLGLDHHIVNHTPEMDIKLAKELVYAMEHPTFGISHGYTLSKYAKEKGKVVMLSGLGGDELLGGYVQHVRAKKYGKNINLGYLSTLFANMFEKLGNQKMARVSRMSGNTVSKLLGLKLSLGKNEAGNILLDKNIKPIDWQNLFRYDKLSKSFFRIVETELIYNQLEGNYLKIADRMSMAASIEMRVPLLDTRLLEYTLTLPASEKIVNGITKFGLRQLAEKVLPKEISYRGTQAHDKGGYGYDPIDFWNRGLKEYIDVQLDPKNIKEFAVFDEKWIRKTLNNANTHTKIRVLWNIASTHDLMDIFNLSI